MSLKSAVLPRHAQIMRHAMTRSPHKSAVDHIAGTFYWEWSRYGDIRSCSITAYAFEKHIGYSKTDRKIFARVVRIGVKIIENDGSSTEHYFRPKTAFLLGYNFNDKDILSLSISRRINHYLQT